MKEIAFKIFVKFFLFIASAMARFIHSHCKLSYVILLTQSTQFMLIIQHIH